MIDQIFGNILEKYAKFWVIMFKQIIGILTSFRERSKEYLGQILGKF